MTKDEEKDAFHESLRVMRKPSLFRTLLEELTKEESDETDKCDTSDLQEVFVGNADEMIRILGRTYAVKGSTLQAEIRIWDLDENGNLQKDENGDVKVHVITDYIESIRIHVAKDVDLAEV